MGAFERLEREVLHLVTCRLHSPWARDALLFLQESEVALVVGLLAVLVLAIRDRRMSLRALLSGAAAAGLALALGSLLWAVIDRPRPQRVYERLLVTAEEQATCAAHPEALAMRTHGSKRPSFPSHHALSAGALAMVFWLAWRPVGIAAWLYALLVAYARLYAGKHWPSDVVAGLLLGAGVGWAVWRLWPPVAIRLGIRLVPPDGRGAPE
jgi:undecaprenyl-diphosphatase